MDLDVRHSAHPSPRRKNYWEWSVWVDGSDDALDQVEEVHYFLHPSFPQSHRIRTDRADKFRMTTAGWGEFRLPVLIVLKDGTEIEREIWLSLDLPEDRDRNPAASVFLSHAASDTDLAETAKASLERSGVRVLGADSLMKGVPWHVSLSRMLDQADALVVLLPLRHSTAIQTEIELATARNVAILPFAIGPDRMATASDVDRQHVAQLAGAENIGASVRETLARLRLAESRGR